MTCNFSINMTLETRQETGVLENVSDDGFKIQGWRDGPQGAAGPHLSQNKAIYVVKMKTAVYRKHKGGPGLGEEQTHRLGPNNNKPGPGQAQFLLACFPPCQNQLCSPSLLPTVGLRVGYLPSLAASWIIPHQPHGSHSPDNSGLKS